jgi:tape measure domain-containing protein
VAQPIDTASVAIVPDFSQFDSIARRDVGRSLRAVAAEAERAFEQVERAAGEAGRDVAREFRTGGAVAEGAVHEVATQSRIMAAQVAASSAAAGSSLGGRLAAGAAVAKAALLGVGAAATAGLGAIAFFGLQSAARLEQTQIGFESLLGSAEDAKIFLEELQQFAAETPFEFAGIADASRRILAFGTSVGITRDEVIPTITTIGNLVSVLGGTQENTDGVISAFGQIASKGRLMGGEILQIAEQLPGFNANQAIAAHLGVSVAEALELQESGAIDARTAIEGLLAGMEQFPGAAGAMERQAQTLLGVFSTFKDTIAIALTNAFQPVIPAIKDALAEVTPIFEDALNVLAPALGGLVAALLPLFGELTQAFTPILTPILEGLTGLIDAITPALRPLGEAIGTIFEAIGPLLPVLGQVFAEVMIALAPVIEEVGAQLVALAPTLGDLLVALVPVLPPLLELLALFLRVQRPLIQLGALLLDLATRFLITPIIAFLTAAFEGFVIILGEVVDVLTGTDWGGIWDGITNTFTSAIGTVGDLFTGLKDGVTEAIGTVVTTFTNLPATIGSIATELLTKFVNLGKDIVAGVVQGIRNAAGNIGSALRDAASAALSGVKDFLGIGSPSRLFAEQVGRWIPPGIGLGVEQATPALAGQVGDLVGQIASVVGRGAGGLGGVSVVNNFLGPVAAEDAPVVAGTVGRSVQQASRRAQVALAVRSM